MLTPAVPVAGSSSVKCVVAIRTRKGHREMLVAVLQGVDLRAQVSPSFMARPIHWQRCIARILNKRNISWRPAAMDFVKVRGSPRDAKQLEGGGVAGLRQ